ncbi:hypothetical protein Cgig2_027709 [Carnegiea gigantea]|uniref:Uncharacterized protein n=1 Tax=Carnegiea gigantea TaxID=171969 RepID=A0A9Q1JW54_9CARY|nr:hypothetical protein Cgig2_027709 [Carnegiea gigantea]
MAKPWLQPAPTYMPLESFWDSDDDAPGPRCGHTLTSVAATKAHGPRLILFGGATAIEGGATASSAPGIRLAGVTNSVHSFDGGIGPAGHSTDDLYVLDLTNDKYKWHRVVVQWPGPGPRYGHVMDLVAQRYLVTVSGNDAWRRFGAVRIGRRNNAKDHVI